MATDASSGYVDTLNKAAAPCQMMVFKANLDQKTAMLQAQVDGTLQGYTNQLANSQPDPVLTACWAKARTDAAAAYKAFAATAKSEKVKGAAKAVLSAWLNTLGTDGVSDSDSAEEVALRKAQSDLEAEAMTE